MFCIAPQITHPPFYSFLILTIFQFITCYIQQQFVFEKDPCNYYIFDANRLVLCSLRTHS